jgi:hypothetical protein
MSFGPRPRRDRRDARLALVLFIVFLVMTVTATSYPGAARLFPVMVGCAGLLLSGALAVKHLSHLSSGRAHGESLRARVVMFGWFTFAVVLIAVWGIVIGSLLFLLAFLRIRERESVAYAVAISGGVPLILHLVLERGLGLVLYPGLLWR